MLLSLSGVFEGGWGESGIGEIDLNYGTALSIRAALPITNRIITLLSLDYSFPRSVEGNLLSYRVSHLIPSISLGLTSNSRIIPVIGVNTSYWKYEPNIDIKMSPQIGFIGGVYIRYNKVWFHCLYQQVKAERKYITIPSYTTETGYVTLFGGVYMMGISIILGR